MNKQELRTNKQELISKYELIKNSFNFDTVATDGIISDLKRLDEPEKVKVSEEEEKFLKRLIKAILDGYEVEKKKRYLVRVNGISGHSCYLNKGLLSEEYFFASQSEVNVYRTKHTRKELEEAGLGEVFNSSLFEVVEVE